MDRKVINIVMFVILSFVIYSCKPSDVDSVVLGQLDYTIVNLSNHKCTIKAISHGSGRDSVCAEISHGDSVLFHTDGQGSYSSYYGLFDGNRVFAMFDDSLSYDCKSNMGFEMFALDRNYQIEEVSPYPNYHYKYRYVITEEDYEYAKAHPYTGEK